MKVAKQKASWLRNVTAYTLAGAATSLFIGASLGSVGMMLGLGHAGTEGIAAALVVATIAGARELGWKAIPLPQLGRQTEGTWDRLFGSTAAAVLWGLDLGLFATTWLTFAGAWLIPILALLSGSAALGALLFIVYWLGRAVSVWIAPAFMRTGTDTSHMMNALEESRRVVQLVHVAGLAWAIAILAVMASSSVSG